MKNNQEFKNHWKRFIIFSLSIGLVVGIFSVISDHIPSIGEKMMGLETAITYLAVMINSLPVWFIFAMIIGYKFARNIKEALFFGALYTIIAITFYFLFGYIYESFIYEGVIPVSTSFKDQLKVYAEWYGASTAGGLVGGALGYLFKKNRFVLLFLVLGITLQLFVNGARSWDNPVGIAQNVSFCLMIISIFIYLSIVWKKNRNKKQSLA
ncbi:hypothetical protein [Thalassobacillus devorans]|uniref:hypothetical protein n=1 Tax=Thalassobacillus devorans TaxID=279813 RepID=UPI00048E083C|nr:hypothetical protein [Thalassobacillus devorans]